MADDEDRVTTFCPTHSVGAPPAAPQPRSAAPPPDATTDTPEAPGGAGGFWARVRRVFGGE